jgi:hypothetical protein
MEHHNLAAPRGCPEGINTTEKYGQKVEGQRLEESVHLPKKAHLACTLLLNKEEIPILCFLFSFILFLFIV